MWVKKPMCLDHVSSDIDYILFIDENGSNDIKHIQRSLEQELKIDIFQQFFYNDRVYYKSSIFT